MAAPLLALRIASAAVHGAAEQPAPSKTTPMVVVVLDDTALVGVEQARLAAAGVDAVHRALLTGPTRVGAITSGPGGLAIDATDDTTVLASIAESLRQGVYMFKGSADPEKATLALDATVESIVGSLARFKDARKVLVVIGRSAAVSAERRARLELNAAGARRIDLQVVWLDLERGGCDASPRRDATTLAEPAACGVLADSGTVALALDGARRFLGP